MMHLASAVAVALGGLLAAAPVDATILEISTSLAASDARDPRRLEQAVTRAVRTAVDDAGSSFVPTLVVITRTVTVGDTVYIRIVISDDTPPSPPSSATPPTNDI